MSDKMISFDELSRFAGSKEGTRMEITSLALAREAQRQCEAKMLEALRLFVEQTGCHIDRIDFDDVRYVNGTQDISFIRLRVTL